MHNTDFARQPLLLEDLCRTPRLRVHDQELPTLADPFGIDDWRNCLACRAHTPHSGAICLGCESVVSPAETCELGS